MRDTLSSHLDPRGIPIPSGTKNGQDRHYIEYLYRAFAILVMTVLLAPLVFAQASPRVTGIDPSAGKVNDTVTITGENLGIDSVSAVFLSDDTTDYKATLVEQTSEKIVIKIPEVKPGNFRISVQMGNKILIGSVKFKVQE